MESPQGQYSNNYINKPAAHGGLLLGLRLGRERRHGVDDSLDFHLWHSRRRWKLRTTIVYIEAQHECIVIKALKVQLFAILVVPRHGQSVQAVDWLWVKHADAIVVALLKILYAARAHIHLNHRKGPTCVRAAEGPCSGIHWFGVEHGWCAQLLYVQEHKLVDRKVDTERRLEDVVAGVLRVVLVDRVATGRLSCIGGVRFESCHLGELRAVEPDRECTGRKNKKLALVREELVGDKGVGRVGQLGLDAVARVKARVQEDIAHGRDACVGEHVRTTGQVIQGIGHFGSHEVNTAYVFDHVGEMQRVAAAVWVDGRVTIRRIDIHESFHYF